MSSSRDSVRNTLALCAAAVAIGVVATPSQTPAQTRSSPMAPQSSSDRGVTIEVTPKAIGPGARRWEFNIELHTHSSDVSDDLTQSAVLVTDDGRTLKPAGWSDTKLGATPRGPPELRGTCTLAAGVRTQDYPARGSGCTQLPLAALSFE
jgi:hypothetical protein